MRELSPAAQKALAYWPQIEYAAAYRMTTADLWNAIRDEAERLGLASPGVPLQGVNELRGIATRIQASSDRLNAARDEQRITRLMRAEAPWRRTYRAQRANPMFSVRFAHTFTSNGEQFTEWRTSVFQGRAPATVGQLRQLIENDARNLAKDYGVEHVSADDLQMLVI